MKKAVKRLLSLAAPNLANVWEIRRREKHVRKFLSDMGMPALCDAYIARNGLDVRHGPFEGMQYVQGEAVGSALIPKLTGSYEAEVHPYWEEILTQKFDTVVDIGCAEGYFAVGLARRLPGATVYAFDTNLEAQALCRSMAERNSVSESVKVLGHATHEELGRVVQGRTLLLCDCDGCETAVLVPQALPALLKADIVVEVHDYLDDTITPTLRSRFEKTHAITFVPSVAKDPADYPELDFFNPEDRLKAINEYRPQQGWLVMRALSSATN